MQDLQINFAKKNKLDKLVFITATLEPPSHRQHLICSRWIPFEEVLITAQPKNEEDMGGVLKKAALQSLKRGVDVFVAVAHYLPLALDSIYRGIQESHRVAPQTSKNQIDETMLLWRS